jgi:8-oxo-dGTP diphosphatase
MKQSNNTNVQRRRSLSPQPRVEVAAGLVLHDSRYLITRRKADVHLGGLWEFPGGKRESGETLEDCLRRELREELGIEITPPLRFKLVRHRYHDKTVELHFYRCGLKSGVPKALGCDRFHWVLPHELEGYDFPPADRPLVEALKQEAAQRKNG